MLSAREAVLASWSFAPWVTALNLLAALVYLRGWLGLRLLLPRRFGAAQLSYFWGGLAALQTALTSPIDTFDAFSLTDHMAQHLVLMMIVPPLVLLGNPGIALMRGLPRRLRRAAGSLMKWPAFHWILRLPSRPAFCWTAFSMSMIAWHLPRPYDLALRSSSWHEIEHLSFLLTSLLFWWPVIQPWPSRARGPRWGLIPYLLFADFVNSALAAFLVFSGRLFYPFYLQMPRIDHLSTLNDQVLAGASMWVIGSIAFIIPAIMIAGRLLSPVPPAAAAPPLPRRRMSRAALRATLSVLTCVLPAAALLYGFAGPQSVDVDGAVVRAQSQSGPFLITVFASPGSVTVGANDLAVLVRDSRMGDPVLDASVTVTAAPASSPESAEREAVQLPAVNRLLRGVAIKFPYAGSWDVRVLVQRGAERGEIHSSIDVVEEGKG